MENDKGKTPKGKGGKTQAAELPVALPVIEEIIIVEGRDDTQAVKRAVRCQTIETHGFGLSDEMWREIDTAAKKKGLIVLTDPDSAGERIRKKITERFPDAAHAYLPRGKALKGDNVGVENARPEDIREALEKAARPVSEIRHEFTMEDLARVGLTGKDGSRAAREQLADRLGIGYGNARAILKKLNAYGISREDFDEAIRSQSDQIHKE